MVLLNKPRIITLIILVLTVLFAWLIIKNPKTTHTQKPKAISYHVDSKLIQYQDYHPTFKLIAKVTAQEHTMLKSSQSAKVEKILVKEGQSVLKHQILMQLSEPEVAIDVARIHTENEQLHHSIDLHEETLLHLKKRYSNQTEILDIQKKSYARQQKLFQSKSIAKSTYDQALSTYTKARMDHNQVLFNWNKEKKQLLITKAQQQALQARLQHRQTQLHDLTVRAPFDGIVMDKKQSIGAEVQAQSPLIELYNPKSLELEAFISQNNLAAFKKAQDANQLGAYIIENNSHTNLPLVHLAQHIDSKHHFIPISFSLVQASQATALGSYVPIYITLPKIHALAIDPKALFHEGYLYTIVDHQLKAHQGKVIGQTYNQDGQLALLIKASSVKNGDRLLTSPLSQARAGLKVSYG